MTASVILMCFLISVRMTFFVPAGFAAGAAAAGAISAAAAAPAPAPRPPSGMSMERPAIFSAASIWMCMVPPVIVVEIGAAAGLAAAAGAGAAGATAGAPTFAPTWSSTSAVIGVRASTSCVSVEPRTSATVRPSGLSFSRPASSMSSKISGSSRSAALMVNPFCRRQQKTAGSAR